MKAIWKAIDGNKTYIGMILAGALGISWSYGVVNDETAGLLASLIATWTGISLRHGIAKAEKSREAATDGK